MKEDEKLPDNILRTIAAFVVMHALISKGQLMNVEKDAWKLADRFVEESKQYP